MMTSGATMAPSLSVYKPRQKSPPVFTRANASRRSRKKPPLKQIKEVELLTFEWKDLPPIEKLKGAIVRRKVSDGISYLLPVDKGQISINNKFRTDLRFMFQEPYSEEMPTYDESRVRATAKVHFDHNSCRNRVTREQIDSRTLELNSDSDKAFREFSRTVPKTGAHGARVCVSPDKTQKRSSLFIPVKAFVPPEAQKMRDDAQKILDSLNEEKMEKNNTATNPDTGATNPDTADSKREKQTTPMKKRRQSTQPPSRSSDASSSNASKKSYLSAAKFKSYEDLKSTPTPTVPELPEMLKRSVHITPSRAKEIWDWLHDGEALSEFEYFLSICG